MEKKRGVGVYIFGIAGIILSSWGLFFIVSKPGSIIPKSSNILWALANIGFEILPLAGLAAAIGVLLLKNWARIVYIIAASILLSMSLFAFLTVLLGGRFNLQGFIVGTVIGVFPFLAAIIYFTRPKVKALFSPPQPKA